MQGICFIEPLFHKVVKGEKTQTRRIIDFNRYNERIFIDDKIVICETQNQGDIIDIRNCDDLPIFKIKPKYKLGETVYLKEPYIIFEETYSELRQTESGLTIAYKYGNTNTLEEITGDLKAKWSNKLFMPEYAARYFIEIIDVRAERLQDISEEDCLKEGIVLHQIIRLGQRWFLNGLKDKNNNEMGYETAKKAYAALIDKINGKGTWERNPLVWVYDFKLKN